MALEEIRRRFVGPANVDWCEANFVKHPLIAEFYNTMSSIPLAVIPLFGVCYTRFKATREARWLVAYLMFSSVGVGSFLFHMTLYYGCQAMDELPMLYCNLVFMFIFFNEKVPEDRRPYFPWALGAYGVLQTCIYFLFPSLYEFFLFSYISLVVVCVVWSYRRITAWHSHPSNRIQARMFWVALAFYGGGSAVWIVENTLVGWHIPGGWNPPPSI